MNLLSQREDTLVRIKSKGKQEICKKMVALTQESSGKKAQGCSCTSDLKGNESTLEQEIKRLQERLLRKVPTHFEKQIQRGANRKTLENHKDGTHCSGHHGKTSRKISSKNKCNNNAGPSDMAIILRD